MACKSIYWTNINDDIEKHKTALHVLIFGKHDQKKRWHLEIPAKPWEIVGTDMFTLHNKNYLCIVYDHSIFSVIKMVEDFYADTLILTCKIDFFSEYSLPKKLMSHSGGNFISNKLKTFCRSLNI